MKTKIIPFDLETAKKIQSGEVEGRIMNHQTETVRIFAFDVQNKKCIVGAVKPALSEGEYIAEWDTKGKAFDDVKESFLDLLIELTEEAPEEQHPIEESELYQAGYKVGFEAGRCVEFDEKKGCVIKKETPKYDDVEEVPTGDGSIVFLRHKKHEFKPFDKVLVRDGDDGEWETSYFSHIRNCFDSSYYVAGNIIWNQCIPYEGHENLVGTTDKPKEE